MNRLAILTALVALTGCDRRLDDDPPRDVSAPDLVIDEPVRGSLLQGDEVWVRGRATDTTGIARVTVDRQEVPLGEHGRFEARVPLRPGIQLVETTVEDGEGNERRDTRAVMVGPLADPGATVQDAASLHLGAGALAGLGRTLGSILEASDLGALARDLGPVLDAGGSCLGATVSIDEVSLAAPVIDLVPGPEGLATSVTGEDLYAAMDVEFAVACVSGSARVTLAADAFGVDGILTAGVVRGGVEAELGDTEAEFEGVELDLGTLPNEIIDLIVSDLDAAAASAVSAALEIFVPSLIEGSFRRLSGEETLAILGSELKVELRPSEIRIDDGGLAIAADLKAAPAAGPGTAYPAGEARGSLPQPGGADVHLAVRVAAINQALAALWSAGAMTQTVELGDARDGPPQRLDGARLEMLLPPAVAEESDSDALVVAIGDVLVDALRDEGDAATVLTRLAVSARLELSASIEPVDEGAPASGGALHIDATAPVVAFNVVDQGPDALDTSEVENLASFAATRLATALGDLFAGLPLPALGGVTLREASARAQDGYLVLRAALAP